jgi:methyltransferase (TIGR00027 family)
LLPHLPSVDDDPNLAALKEAFVGGIAIRTRFYDEFLATACAAGCRQVVLLAAGLDARAFRLDWPPDTRVFELDLPTLFAFKETVLSQERATPKCARTVVGVDLRDDWPAALVAAGFESDLPAVWTAEGLLAYLGNDDAERLLTRVGDLSAAGSELAFEYDDFAAHSTLSQLRAMPGMQGVASMWQGGLLEQPAAWLAGHGWRVRTHDRASLAETYRRPLKDATGGFVAAIRR